MRFCIKPFCSTMSRKSVATFAISLSSRVLLDPGEQESDYEKREEKNRRDTNSSLIIHCMNLR